MTGRQQPYFARSSFGCFLPVNLVFIAAFAALKVSFPGACPGKDIFLLYDGDDNSLATQNACSCVFSPVDPLFILTGDNALPLTAFALAFSPVCPLSENDGKTN